MTILVLLAMSAPLPPPKPMPADLTGTYRMTAGYRDDYTLTLVGVRSGAGTIRGPGAYGGTVTMTIEWECDGRTLALREISGRRWRWAFRLERGTLSGCVSDAPDMPFKLVKVRK